MLTRSHAPSAHNENLHVCLLTGSITASEVMSEFTWSGHRSASPILLYHGLVKWRIVKAESENMWLTTWPSATTQIVWIYEGLARVCEEPPKLQESMKVRQEGAGPNTGNDIVHILLYDEMMSIYAGISQIYAFHHIGHFRCPSFSMYPPPPQTLSLSPLYLYLCTHPSSFPLHHLAAVVVRNGFSYHNGLQVNL